VVLGDVGDIAVDANDAAVLNHRPATCSYPDPLSVRANQPKLEIVGLAFGNQPPERCFDKGAAHGEGL